MKIKRTVASDISVGEFGIPSLIFGVLIPICLLTVGYVCINKDSTAFLLNSSLPGVNQGMVFFTIWLLTGVSVAFISGALSFIDFFVKRSLSSTVIGAVASILGIYEVFYFIMALNEPAGESYTYERWLISRALHLVLISCATLYFSFGSLRSIRNPKNRNAKLLAFYAFNVFALALAMAATFLFKSSSVWDIGFAPLNYPLDLLIVIGYLFLGTFILPVFLKRFPTLFGSLLGLSFIPAVLSSLLIVFHRHPFDVFFNAAYFLRLIQYLLPLIGIGLNYIESSNRERRTVKQLRVQIRERILTQQKLKEREMMMANAEKIAHLGSWKYDPQTEELNWSDEMYTILGEKINSFKPQSGQWRKWVTESTREVLSAKIAEAISNKTSYTVEFQIKRPNGEIRHVLSQGHCAEDGKLMNIMLDITEIKEAGFKIEQSEALLKEAESLAHNGSWEWSQEKNMFYWSDEMYRIHGLEPQNEEIDLRFYLTLIHPDDVARFVTTLADTQTLLEPFSVEYRIIRPDQTIRYLSLNGKFKTDITGTVQKVLGNTQDITDLKNASIRLEQSESIYKTIVRNVPDSAVFLFDKEFKLLISGGPALKDVDPDALINNGHDFHYLFFKSKDSQPLLYFNSAFDGEENSLEHRINNKIFKITFTPVYLTGGAVFGVMVVMMDITDLKIAQQSLEVKVNELNRSNKDLEQFAYIASHDLQEPLRKIRAFGERLNIKYKASLQEEGVDYLNRMNSASERMQLLINDLLTFSRINKIEEELKPGSLIESIKQVTNDLEFSIEKQKATINIACGHEVKVSPSLLRHLFQNLFSNSLKFARKDEPLVITVRSETVAGSSRTGLKNNRKYCKIEVSDNGIGFENQFSEKIFTLFHRLHGKSEYEGTGIGLAICKKIVESHNGLIEAEGVPDKGATFRIFLPID